MFEIMLGSGCWNIMWNLLVEKKIWDRRCDWGVKYKWKYRKGICKYNDICCKLSDCRRSDVMGNKRNFFCVFYRDINIWYIWMVWIYCCKFVDVM